jgi:hypothetical protein
MYKITKAKDLVSGKEFDVNNNKFDVDVNGTQYLILQLR